MKAKICIITTKFSAECHYKERGKKWKEAVGWEWYGEEEQLLGGSKVNKERMMEGSYHFILIFKVT